MSVPDGNIPARQPAYPKGAMISDGELKAIEVKDGWWRWRYITIHGAEHIGGRLWKTKAAATRDGRAWLKDQQNA